MTSRIPGEIGEIIVVSRRRGGVKAPPWFTVIPADRSCPVLGNRHVMVSESGRDEVMRLFCEDLGRDEICDGPITRKMREIADRLKSGENVALECWCAPRRCHADVLADKIRRIAHEET